MKKNIFNRLKISIFLLILVFPFCITFASSSYDGKVLFEKESNKFYYVNSQNSKIYELNKNNFSSLFKSITVGLKNKEIVKIFKNQNLLNKYKGKFLLETDNKGILWYVDFNGKKTEIKTRNLENDLKLVSKEISKIDFEKINNPNKNTNVGLVPTDVSVIINPSQTPQDTDFTPFFDAWNFVKEKYSGSLDYKKMLEGAISGMTSSLGDDYSVFMNKESSDSFMTQLTGDLEGIGAQIELKNEFITVVSPIDSSPAQKSGLKPGDKILKIDNVDAKGISVDKAVSLIRGKAGTIVKLEIQRSDDTKQTFLITREKIHMPFVSWELKNENIGYIKIVSFGMGSEILVNQAIDELSEKGADKFIIDLRNNPGGYLDTAVKMSEVWIDGKTVVVQKYKLGIADSVYTAGSNLKINGKKTIVLVNGGSASASEILAGALQDYKLATIVGEKTFGKGSVQEMITMSDGSSIKVTTSKWYTPFGRSIDGNGIIPDVIIPLNNLEVDNQLEQAILLINSSR